MEYLVGMTTKVPDGTPDATVEEIQSREATRARELAAEGHLLRLWRPPLQPGEWRSLGLLAAADDAELEQILASMPLHVWRTDEAMPLAPHPHDPAPGRVVLGPVGVEYLTTLIVTVPPGTPRAVVDDVYAREGDHSHKLGEQGLLRRLWRLPGERRSLSQWQVADADHLQEVLASLPLADWLRTKTTPVTRHPNDPAAPTMS
jgi:muconolactone delta-isomerase